MDVTSASAALYLDASAFVSLLMDDSSSGRAQSLLSPPDRPVSVSTLTMAEFASVVARRHRTGELNREEALNCVRDGEAWVRTFATVVDVLPEDFAQATSWIARLDHPLRAPDALHLSIARRQGACLMTFDRQMAVVAQSLDVGLLT